MKSFCFFVLSWSDWEDYVPYFFIGPGECSEEEFRKICCDLAPEAGLNVLAEHQNQDYASYIGWSEVVQGIIPLLEQRGFTHIKPKRANFNGSGIIDQKDSAALGPVADNVIYYNRNINYQSELEYQDDNEGKE